MASNQEWNPFGWVSNELAAKKGSMDASLYAELLGMQRKATASGGTEYGTDYEGRPLDTTLDYSGFEFSPYVANAKDYAFPSDIASNEGMRNETGRPEFNPQAWLDENGYSLISGPAGDKTHARYLVDKNGKQVGDSQIYDMRGEEANSYMMMAAILGAGAAAGGAFGGGASSLGMESALAPAAAEGAAAGLALPAAEGAAAAGSLSSLTPEALAALTPEGFAAMAGGGEVVAGGVAGLSPTALNLAKAAIPALTTAYGINQAGKAAGAAQAAQQSIADQQAAISGRQLTLAEQQYADQKALLDKLMPFYQKQMEQSIAEQAKSSARGDQQWESYLTDFQPIEKKMAATALNYDTPERRAIESRLASDGVGTEFDRARQATQTALTDAGVAPGGGRMLALDNASRIQEATARAGAADKAAKTVETTGLSLVDNAARFGRNMPSTGIATAGLALNQGQAAGSSAAQQVSNTAAPTTYTTPLFNSASNTIGQSGNSSQSAFNNAAYGQQQKQQLFGDLLGAGLQAYGMGVFGSSEDIKEIHGDAELSLEDAAQLLGSSKSKVYNYVGDNPDQKYMGPTAQDMQRVTGVGDGQTIDPRNMLGLHQAILGEVVNELLALKGQRGGQTQGRPVRPPVMGRPLSLSEA